MSLGGKCEMKCKIATLLLKEGLPFYFKIENKGFFDTNKSSAIPH